jgi:hypothetical protein
MGASGDRIGERTGALVSPDGGRAAVVCGFEVFDGQRGRFSALPLPLPNFGEEVGEYPAD